MGRRLLSSLVLAGALSSCVAKQAEEPPPAAPESQAAPRLSDLDALEHDLGVAEQRLDAELGKKQLAIVPDRDRPEDEGGAAEKEDDAFERKSEERSEPPAGQTAQPSRAAPEWNQAELATPCDMACRALASMKRSAERICELAGPSDARCTNAKSRVERAQERIQRSGCACRER